MTLAEAVLERARAQQHMIVTAESCTGGMIAAALTDVPGSSAVVDRGFITYSNAAKREMLGVTLETLDAHGAVSEPVALEMARGALDASAATLAVSVTGIAGPGGSEHKPEGRVCFACVSKEHEVVETIEFGARGRGNVRREARDHALQMLLDATAQLPGVSP